jgi:hypothetical protein
MRHESQSHGPFYFYHGPRCPDPATRQVRPLRRSELPGTVLRLTKSGRGNWTCSSVRLLIDGRSVLERREEFVLSGSNPSVEIPIMSR